MYVDEVVVTEDILGKVVELEVNELEDRELDELELEKADIIVEVDEARRLVLLLVLELELELEIVDNELALYGVARTCKSTTEQ